MRIKQIRPLNVLNVERPGRQMGHAKATGVNFTGILVSARPGQTESLREHLISR